MSKEILKLSSPLKINGQNMKELSYTLKLDVDDVFIAHDHRAKAHNNMDTAMKLVEFDTELHLYMGMQAIIKLNPQIDVNDLKRLHGVDVVNLLKIGRAFFTQTDSMENSQQSETSKESSVTTQGDTTVQN